MGSPFHLLLVGPLRRALTRMGAGNLATVLISEAMDNSLSYSVLNYLKRLKNQAKMEYDRIVSVTPYKGKVGPDGIKVNVKSQLKRELMDGLPGSSLREQVNKLFLNPSSFHPSLLSRLLPPAPYLLADHTPAPCTLADQTFSPGD